MPRRIEEDDGSAIGVDPVRTDMLRDAARFSRSDVRLADAIEQRRLSMVDVSHHGDDGCADLAILLGVHEITAGISDDLFLGARDVLNFIAELDRENACGIGVERAVDVHAAHTELDELHEQVGALDAHALRKLLKLDLILDADLPLLLARNRDGRLEALLTRGRTPLTHPRLRPARRPDRGVPTNLAARTPRLNSLFGTIVFVDDAASILFAELTPTEADRIAALDDARGKRRVCEAIGGGRRLGRPTLLAFACARDVLTERTRTADLGRDARNGLTATRTFLGRLRLLARSGLFANRLSTLLFRALLPGLRARFRDFGHLGCFGCHLRCA